VLQARESAPTPSPRVVFTFGLTVESIEKLGVLIMVSGLNDVQGFIDFNLGR
jgi:hypothetical protein